MAGRDVSEQQKVVDNVLEEYLSDVDTPYEGGIY
jgi:hypothetical protein